MHMSYHTKQESAAEMVLRRALCSLSSDYVALGSGTQSYKR